MKRLAFYLLFCLVANTILYAQATKKQEVDSYFHSKKEIHFKFAIADRQEINSLTKIISIDNVKGNEVYAYANKAEFIKFLELGLSYTVIKQDSKETGSYNMATTVAEMSSWDRYPTYAVYEQMMQQFQTNFPSICKVDTILESTPNIHKILAVKISDNVNLNENEPHFLYSSSMHGDETTGYILMLRLIDYLLKNHETDPKVATLVNNTEIWICPLANPDGTYDSGNNIINATSATRYNANSVDLNRNYPDPLDGLHPDGNAWQPETQAFMTFADNHYFNMSANFHGGAEVFNYPWDTWTTSNNSHADASWFEKIGRAYVDTSRRVFASYMTDTYASGITEGGDWYVITGGRQDYMNFYKQCREVTIELDDIKTTQTQNLPVMWNYNYKSMLNYIEESLYGVRGLVTDSCTGLPIRAKVFVNSHDNNADSSFVYSNPVVGNYHRYLINGTYSITYSAPGYISKTVNNVILTNGNATIVDVQLSKAKPVSGFTNSTNGFLANFTNSSTGATSFYWNFGDGSAISSIENPSHTYTENGVYNVQLIAMNSCFSDTITIPVTINTTSIKESEHIKTSVYPNPSNGIINIQISESANKTGTIKIYDRCGRIVYNKNINLSKTDNPVIVDLRGKEKGLYLINMNIEGKTISHKIHLTE